MYLKTRNGVTQVKLHRFLFFMTYKVSLQFF